MTFLLHDTLAATAARAPHSVLLVHDRQGSATAIETLWRARSLASQLGKLGIKPNDRVAIYLPKTPDAAIAFYATSMAGAVFVPVNSILKPAQVAHILNDCGVRVVVTSGDWLKQICDALANCPSVETVVIVDTPPELPKFAFSVTALDHDASQESLEFSARPRIDNDMAAILYTSGSTGKPKGVVISHRNIVTGAQSVAQYLELTSADRLLAVLPFSFDYGLNQLTSAVLTGASCVLLDYLLAGDVIKCVARHEITGLAAVPPLWTQLAPLEWPQAARDNLRYFTNSGGAMPEAVLKRLRTSLPRSAPYLMYGLTEAFRSTYLPPGEIDCRPNSIGKAIPNAEILVINEQGRIAKPGEHGELVHRGALVSLGYWNDIERTAARFKPAPGQPTGLPCTELAVWSGDTVYQDEEGYLFFVGRKDGMIKTSGYRVSPEEIEEVVYASDSAVQTAAAIGVNHARLGHGIVLVLQAASQQTIDEGGVLASCKRSLPAYMVPQKLVYREDMPHNPNGKINRRQLAEEYADLFHDIDDS